MARKRGNRVDPGPAQGNPGSAKVVTVGPHPNDDGLDGPDLDFGAALEPAVKTYRPDRDMLDNDFSAPTPEPEAQEEQPPAQEEQTEETPQLPTWKTDQRFSGDPEKVYSSYRELEQKLSQQGNEIGEYRKFFDTYMKQQMQQMQAPVSQPANDTGEPSPEDVELLNKMLGKPKQFIEEMREQFYQGLQQMSMQNQLAQMKAHHAQTLSDPAFASWLTQSVPFQVAEQADRDPRMFKYLMDTYQTIQTSSPQQAKQVAQEELASKAKKVHAAAGFSGGSKPAGEKVWSRREIMKLQLQKPEEYARLARPGGAIYEAYASGRVKD